MKRAGREGRFGDVEVASVYTHFFGTHVIKGKAGGYDRHQTCVEYGCKPATRMVVSLEGEYDEGGVKRLIADLTAALAFMATDSVPPAPVRRKR